MKCLTAEATDVSTMSLPVRGAWIEMPDAGGRAVVGLPSLPVRGAWIEISKKSLVHEK